MACYMGPFVLLGLRWRKKGSGNRFICIWRVSFLLIRENDLVKATKQVPVSFEIGGCIGWYYFKGVFMGQNWDSFKTWG